jgi:carbon monoxide dehydrogenase subunit G
MRMEEKFIIPAPRAAVWGSLIDPHVVGPVSQLRLR